MFVDDHCEAVVSDLSRYHGRRLGDLFTGRMSWFELECYLARLPMESALRTEQRDAMTDEELADVSDEIPAHGPWSKVDYLLAEIKDEIARLTYATLRMNAKDPDKIQPPEPRRRPGVAGRRGPKVDPVAVAFLETIRRRHREAV